MHGWAVGAVAFACEVKLFVVRLIESSFGRSRRYGLRACSGRYLQRNFLEALDADTFRDLGKLDILYVFCGVCVRAHVGCPACVRTAEDWRYHMGSCFEEASE